MQEILTKINQHSDAILDWLNHQEQSKELPLYTSVDIRDAGFKMSAVDTNLFPAGFNNLCEHGLEDAVTAMREAILARITGCRNVLVIAEEHTRNTWYLENVRILQTIIEQAGFSVKLATFFDHLPDNCHEDNYAALETATGHSVKMYSIRKVVDEICAGGVKPCFIIMNNDLTTGIPEVLKSSAIPMYPSVHAGWHARSKAHHFDHVRELTAEFCKIIDVDPWLLSCYHRAVREVSIHEADDRQRLADEAEALLKDIQTKYTEHGISDKPFLFLKAEQGTYGMGVMPFEDPQQILDLNRKQRNQLHTGKGSQTITRYLLQEGVPTAHVVDDHASEVCVYQIDNQFVGGFYRLNSQKDARANLNSRGMSFEKMCPRSERFAECGQQRDTTDFAVYRILARIAGIAAQCEMVDLSKQQAKTA